MQRNGGGARVDMGTLLPPSSMAVIRCMFVAQENAYGTTGILEALNGQERLHGHS